MTEYLTPATRLATLPDNLPIHWAKRLAVAAVLLSFLALWCSFHAQASRLVALVAALAGGLSLVCVKTGRGNRSGTSLPPEGQFAGMAPHEGSGAEAAQDPTIASLTSELTELRRKASALEERTAALQRADKQRHTQYLSNIMSLVRAVEAKDRYTAGHSDRVSRYAVAIAQKMNDLSRTHEVNVKLTKYAAYLHDIGKIHVREAVLNKPGELTGDEFAEARMHASYTQYILSGLELPEDLSGLALVASFHHERYEGGGYPSGLPAEYIPVEARIIAVADTYDALTSNRPHRLGMPQARALAVMNDIAGTQLDPDIVNVFMRLYREGVITRLQYGGELQPDAERQECSANEGTVVALK